MQESTMVEPTSAQSSPLAIEMRNITKSWPGVVANDDVNLSVRKGEIHALVGENGAGKTTLMNILYGLIHPESGEIYLNGQRVHISGPRDAIRLGIGMVHQHFMLIPPLTVAENIVLGHEPGSVSTAYDAKKAREAVLNLSRQYGLPIQPDTRVERLSVGMQQRVEILKTLYRAAEAKKAREAVLNLSRQYGLPIQPDTRVERLSVGMQQRVEILKTLYRAAEILIMDEPTG